MDAIILAGGRGTRVEGLAPAFYKPLLPYKDVPMVTLAVDLAIRAGVTCPVVVAAPANAEAICEALDGRPAFVVIQRQPLGAGHALLLGLQASPRPLVDCDRVLVLLSDNVSSDSDVNAVTAHPTAVGIQYIERINAFRFARLNDDGRWCEKERLKLDGNPVPCWVGPFVGWRNRMVRVLSEAVEQRKPDEEVYIGPYLGRFMYEETKCPLVPVDSLDLGVTDEYRRLA
jgi:hypothetical protein